MPVVSKTSPIWNLASIERLALLHEQFSEVRLPHEVWQEVQVGQEYPEVVRIQQAVDDRWITVESLTNPYLQQSLMLELDAGESAAIALALELGVNQILLDETDGRAAAKAMGLHPEAADAKNARLIWALTQESPRKSNCGSVVWIWRKDPQGNHVLFNLWHAVQQNHPWLKTGC